MHAIIYHYSPLLLKVLFTLSMYTPPMYVNTLLNPFCLHVHRVLLTGVLLASLSLTATGLVVLPTQKSLPSGSGIATALAAVGATRAAFGLFSAAAMPAVSALAAEVVPPVRKASATALIYAMFNIGDWVLSTV